MTEFDITENIDHYWFKLFIKIPGSIVNKGKKIAGIKEQRASGSFEFVVLKRILSDKAGLCVHRFFRKNS
jgi:hypothetical protein